MRGLVRSAAEAEARRIDEEWGSLRWLASRELTRTELTVGRVTIKAGTSNPRHSHPNCDEVLYLLGGRLEHSVGDDSLVLEAGDTLVVPAGVNHNARNVGEEDADMMVAYTSGERQFRAEA
jgi:quercetin dioxygenase-like cupin family protein